MIEFESKFIATYTDEVTNQKRYEEFDVGKNMREVNREMIRRGLNSRKNIRLFLVSKELTPQSWS